MTSPEPSLLTSFITWMVSCFNVNVLFQTAFRMFLYNCQKLTFYQLGAYDHNVLYTIAQLTEGRSARDQPKQPPAKKNKRERGPVRVPSSLTEDYNPASLLVSSYWNHERTWLRHTP